MRITHKNYLIHELKHRQNRLKIEWDKINERIIKLNEEVLKT